MSRFYALVLVPGDVLREEIGDAARELLYPYMYDPDEPTMQHNFDYAYSPEDIADLSDDEISDHTWPVSEILDPRVLAGSQVEAIVTPDGPGTNPTIPASCGMTRHGWRRLVMFLSSIGSDWPCGMCCIADGGGMQDGGLFYLPNFGVQGGLSGACPCLWMPLQEPFICRAPIEPPRAAENSRQHTACRGCALVVADTGLLHRPGDLLLDRWSVEVVDLEVKHFSVFMNDLHDAAGRGKVRQELV